MNELQKEYFERMEKERAEAEAAEEARLKAVMEAERKKDIKKKEAEKKAKEEAERKAEEEAIEIINRVKAEVAANKIKEEEARKQAEIQKQKEAKREESKKRFEEDQKAKQSADEKQKTGKTVETTAESPKDIEEDNIYEREPVGEASMPKKSPKFKKGNKKGSGAGNVQSRTQPQEAAVTEEKEVKPNVKPKEAKTEEIKGKEPNSNTKKESQVTEKEPETKGKEQEESVENTEKATPESKAAADREAKLQELADEYQDKYKRLLAEFENARAREAKEASRMYDVGAKAVLEKLLPVVDNFERAIQTIPEEDKERAFEQGVDKIYKQMMTTLEDIGVQPMNAEGTEFNPDLHNAVMHVEDEAYGENVVAEEMQKGYMYKDSVLRYSMVKVAN